MTVKGNFYTFKEIIADKIFNVQHERLYFSLTNNYCIFFNYYLFNQGITKRFCYIQKCNKDTNTKNTCRNIVVYDSKKIFTKTFFNLYKIL